MHRGTIEMEFGDGSVAAPAARARFARVDAATVRKVRNVGEGDAVYLCAGGKDGYVGRDGRVPEGEEQRVRAHPRRLRRAAAVSAAAAPVSTTAEEAPTAERCASTAS